MKTILFGNAGAGKSTLARKLTSIETTELLSLDKVAFAQGAVRRPLIDSVADAMAFIEVNDSWIVEGCYADILSPLLPHCESLIFLNPGVDTCVAHCATRAWEPKKFSSREVQDEHLEKLVAWVRTYETREDEYGLKRHRALFDSFAGEKYEFNNGSFYRWSCSETSTSLRTAECVARSQLHA